MTRYLPLYVVFGNRVVVESTDPSLQNGNGTNNSDHVSVTQKGFNNPKWMRGFMLR